MIDLAWIKERCTEDGDCLLWTGKTNGKGQPMAVETVEGKTKSVTIRRRAYELYQRKPLHKGLQVTTCGNPRCLAKEHLTTITLSEKMRRTHAQMPANAKILRSQKLASINQDRKGKVTPEQVEAVKDSPDGPYVTAKRLGISGVVASRIKRGVSYRDYAASPFAGLMG
jgi:hypothetical protein